MRVFAYGSLLWNPGFAVASAERGVLKGWRRSWCVRSCLHRGTPERPGVVLGLVRGGTCCGVVYEVAPSEADRVEAYLDARELCEGGYRKIQVPIETAAGAVEAVVYVSDEPPRAPDLDAIIGARGLSGTNLEYALKTLDALDDLVGRVDETEAGLCANSLSTIRAAAGIRGLFETRTGCAADGLQAQGARQ